MFVDGKNMELRQYRMYVVVRILKDSALVKLKRRPYITCVLYHRM